MSWHDAFEVRTVPPRIESVRPSNGPPEGGNRIAIRGTGFHSVSSVALGDRLADADDIVVLSPEHLEVLVPGPGVEAGPVDVRLTAGGLITTAPNAYTLAATEEQTAPQEESGVAGPAPGCSAGPRDRHGSAAFLSLLLLVCSRVARRSKSRDG